MKEKFNLKLLYLFFKIYILSLSVFFLFRIGLFLINIHRLNDAPLFQIIESFIIGIRFDTVICCYILVLPYFILSVLIFFREIGHLALRILFIFLFTLFSLSFLISSADIPYFSYFFTRFNISAFTWMGTPEFVVKMILQEPRYWVFFIVFILLEIIFYKLLKIIIYQSSLYKIQLSIQNIIVCLLLLGVILLGIRGRIDEKSPIRTGTAYFCNNAFLNQLGLNPNFTFIRSVLEKNKNKKLSVMDPALAFHNLKQYLSFSDTNKLFNLSRVIQPRGQSTPHNVIVILMEGMSYHYLNNNHLTPFLDSISTRSYFFNNCYSAGIHTHNGVFSTLFSFPAIAGKHAMNVTNIKQLNNIASILKKDNYTTAYFTTHDGQFDNIEGFLKNNAFEQVISKKNYPFNKIKTTLGVPDDYMFEFSMKYLDQMSQHAKPFLAVYLTASNHGPYYIPDYFKPNIIHTDIKEQIVEYADWSLRKFITLSKEKPWFKNTVFVFVADHGASISDKFDIPLAYTHVPLIFYAPHILDSNKVFNQMASQIDVVPTILGLLNTSYVNSTMGIDLLKENRPYSIFNFHGLYGVIDKKWLYVIFPDGREVLYKYTENNNTNFFNTNKLEAEQMKKYLFSHIQVFDSFYY